jgi:hypothetical protein
MPSSLALPVSVRLVHSDINVVMGACELIGRNVEGGAASRTYVVTMPSSCLDCCPVERHRCSMGVAMTHCTDRRPMQAPMNTTDAVPLAGRLGDGDRTSALLILASSVDPNLASTCDRVVLLSNDPQPHDQAQRGRSGGRMIGVASCGWSLGWRHADRDQFGPRIRLR